MRTFTELSVPVIGGDLRAIQWGPSPAEARATVIAAHGITASSRSMTAVAEIVPEDVCFVAVDLRGRGDSSTLPGPYGMEQHCDDLIAVADHIGADTFIPAGHSMGAYVVANLATRTNRTPAIVMWDGGFPLPAPVDLDPDAVIEAVVGPAIARLSMTFGSEDEYFDFWKMHPALSEWTDHLEAYCRYDLGGDAPALQPRPNEAAIRADGRQLVVDMDAINAVQRVTVPIELVRATRGIMNDPGGLIPEEAAAGLDAAMENLHLDTVDANHYTLVMGDGAERSWAAVERAIARS